MTGRVKVIKRRAVTTGKLRRQSAPEQLSSVALAEESAAAELSQAIAATPASIELPPPDANPSATVEVVSLGPEASELRVRCACGCETVIALTHPAEGGAA